MTLDDRGAMDEIGILLGNDDWEDPLELVRQISELVEATGRPVPSMYDKSERGDYRSAVLAERIWPVLVPTHRELVIKIADMTGGDVRPDPNLSEADSEYIRACRDVLTHTLGVHGTPNEHDLVANLVAKAFNEL